MATQLTRDTFDPSLYPRTYAVSLGWKLFLVLFGALAGIGGIAGLVFVVFFGPDGVYVGKGALKVPWYQVEDCPKN